MRDDFDAKTVRRLADRAGNRCSLPDCRAHTSGPGDPGESANGGEAAHIRAASPGGARYDSLQSSEQRKSIDNGIWLCRHHSKLIDDASSTYSPEYLEQIKVEAEAKARAEYGRPLPANREIEAIVATAVDRCVERLQDSRERARERREHSLEEFDRQVRTALAEYSNLLESGATTIDALLEEPEFQKIADNYAVEAQREALRERAKMLAYALAGTLFDKVLSISQKSRTERVIRELDPDDVLLLYQVSLINIEQGTNDSFDRSGMARMTLLDAQPGSKDVLRAAGCVSWENNGGFDGGVNYATVTTIGEAVLKILNGYVQKDISQRDIPKSLIEILSRVQNVTTQSDP